MMRVKTNTEEYLIWKQKYRFRTWDPKKNWMKQKSARRSWYSMASLDSNLERFVKHTVDLKGTSRFEMIHTSFLFQLQYIYIQPTPN